VVFDDGDAEEYEVGDAAQLVAWHVDRRDFDEHVNAATHCGRSSGGSFGSGRGHKASRLDALSVDAALSLKETPVFLKQANPKKRNTMSWAR
jgi:hypothetical protein